MPVALRIVNDVSNAMRINHESVAGAVLCSRVSSTGVVLCST